MPVFHPSSLIADRNMSLKLGYLVPGCPSSCSVLQHASVITTFQQINYNSLQHLVASSTLHKGLLVSEPGIPSIPLDRPLSPQRGPTCARRQ